MAPPTPTPALADRRWASNVAANGHALSATQPGLARLLRDDPADLTPVFARDGSLTAFRGGERWWAGCSLPRRAAEAMLKKIEARGGASCFLAPPHAAHLRAALDRVGPGHAIIAVVPGEDDLPVLLGCEDFSGDIRAHRLWFAAGDDWPASLARILADHPGLPMPQQFIRLATTPDDDVQRMIAAAQKVFATENARRAAAVAAARDGWRPPIGGALRRVCVIAPSRFRLWDDTGHALALALMQSGGSEAGAAWDRLDPDDPLWASPVALARAAAAGRAVVAANVARADAPNVVPPALSWLTWLTRLPVPPFSPTAQHDALLVADPAWRAAAVAAGWPAERVGVAGWPPSGAGTPAAGTNAVVMICDTSLAEPDERVTDYSSHHLLWDAIRDELLRDPFALAGRDPAQYLDERMRRAQVAGQGLDRRQFVQNLIAPTFQQGVARALARSGFPFRLYGRGWERIDEFRACNAGPVASREELAGAAAGAAVLVHAWPSPHAHPIEALGRPVVRAFASRGHEPFLRDVGVALTNRRTGGIAAAAEPLSAAAVVRMLGGAALG